MQLAGVSALPPAARRRRFLTAGEIGVVAVYFLVALLSITLTRNSTGASLLWPANAMSGALLVRLPAVRWGRTFSGLLCVGSWRT
jgi:integral membrane sensor domain MASE1